jgi:hypothetical protein
VARQQHACTKLGKSLNWESVRSGDPRVRTAPRLPIGSSGRDGGRSWDELDDPDLRPDRFTVANARERLPRRDPWTGFDACRQTITAAMRRRLSE